MELTTHYTSSEGLDLESKTTRMGFVINAVAHRDGLYQMDGVGRAGVGGLELFDREDPISLARSVGETAVKLLDADTIKGGTYPVVLDQELAGCLFMRQWAMPQRRTSSWKVTPVWRGKLGSVSAQNL